MEPLNLDGLDGALLLVDTAPIIYAFDGHPELAARFAPVVTAPERFVLAVTTVTLAEVLVGPLKAGDELRARRYGNALCSWRVVDLDAEIAESAARFRARYGLKIPDAVQVASALAIGAAALVTHDRDLARVEGMRIVA